MADVNTVKQNFWKSLADLLNDLTTLEVATYVTYDGLESPLKIPVKKIESPALLQAYTKLDLDADTIILLPVKKEENDLLIQEAVLRIHETHVKTALETRAAMVNAMLSAIPSILKLG